MKPKIGQVVYIADFAKKKAYKENVGYLGKYSFIVKYYDIYLATYQERFYEDEGKTWFASLKDLKKACPNARYNRNEWCYVLEEKE